MIITLDIPANVVAQLRAVAAQGDIDAFNRIMEEEIAPKMARQLDEESGELSVDEFDALADQLADECEAFLGPNPPDISNEALTREGMYQDHL